MRFLRKFRESRRGMTTIIIGLIIMLVLIGVALPVGLHCTSSIKGVIDDMDLGTEGNSTRTKLFNNIYSAYDLSVIVPIIAGAALVIGAVTVGFAVYSRRRQ